MSLPIAETEAEWSGVAEQSLALTGYKARPLKRAIYRQAINTLAQHLLGGKFREGDTIVEKPTW
jgi:ATP-dependent Clp protease ATP-binding subunit ClpA